MVASVVITIVCEWCNLPTVPFIHLFTGVVCFRWVLYGIRSWHHYYHTRHQLLLWQVCVHLWDRWRVLRKINVQGVDAVEQEQRDEYGVDDGYEHDVRDNGYGGRSYLDQDITEEEEEDLEMERLTGQQGYKYDYDCDSSEQQASTRCNIPLALEASTFSASTFNLKKQQCRPLCSFDEKPPTKLSAEMWEKVATSWDLAIGTCVSSSTTNDIF